MSGIHLRRLVGVGRGMGSMAGMDTAVDGKEVERITRTANEGILDEGMLGDVEEAKPRAGEGKRG